MFHFHCQTHFASNCRCSDKSVWSAVSREPSLLRAVEVAGWHPRDWYSFDHADFRCGWCWHYYHRLQPRWGERVNKLGIDRRDFSLLHLAGSTSSLALAFQLSSWRVSYHNRDILHASRVLLWVAAIPQAVGPIHNGHESFWHFRCGRAMFVLRYQRSGHNSTG